MSNLITFNNIPFTGVTNITYSEEPVYIQGEKYADTQKIKIEGVLSRSGNNPFDQTSFFGIVEAGFSELLIGTNTISGICEGVEFQDSDYDCILPYACDFFCYESGYDVVNPTSSTTVTEDGPIYVISTSKSAQGVGLGDSALEKAKAFVNSQSDFYSGGNIVLDNSDAILISTNEVFDTVDSIYTLNKVYNLQNPDGSLSGFAGDSGVCKASMNISYNKESDELSASVNGSIQYPLGYMYSATGMEVDPINQAAYDLASGYVVDSLSQKEGYSLENLNIIGSSKIVETDDSVVEFSFDFVQVDPSSLIGENNNILHEYVVSFNIDKNAGGVINGQINGSLSYLGVDNPWDNSIGVSNLRWQQLQGALSGLDFYALTTTSYDSFLEPLKDFYKVKGEPPLNEEVRDYNISYDLNSIGINYSFSFDNRVNHAEIDPSYENLKNMDISMSEDIQFYNKIVKESLIGFSVQEGQATTPKFSIQVSADAKNESGGTVDSLYTLKSFANKFLTLNHTSKLYFLDDSSQSYSDERISCSFKYYFDEKGNFGEQDNDLVTGGGG